MTTFLAAPALPLHSAGKYVAGAYIVFVAVILIYVSIMALRLRNNERDLDALRRELLELEASSSGQQEAGATGERETRPDTEPVP